MSSTDSAIEAPAADPDLLDHLNETAGQLDAHEGHTLEACMVEQLAGDIAAAF
ncbi:hypothetical protein ACWCPS_36150 [Streptomyces mauvecolor]